MWTFIVASTLAFAATPVQVETLDGQQYAGQLQNWTDAGLVIRTKSDKVEMIPLPKLALVRPLEQAATKPLEPAVYVDLVDGSTLAALNYTAAQGTATIDLVGGRSFTVPVKLVAAVRLKKLETADLEKQWEQIRESKPAGDLVVVRKGTSLDFLEGVLGEIINDSVAFKLEGDELSVKRTKLDGIIYFKNQAAALGELTAVVSTNNGLKLQAAKVEWQPGDQPAIAISTLAGAELKIPIAEMSKLDFSAGRMTYLSEMSPESMSYVPFVPLPENQQLLAQFGHPVFNRAFEGGPLRFIPENGSEETPAEYSSGIAMRSQSELVYRLPDKFRRFHAVAFIDARMRGAGNVKLTIFGDERQLLETDVTGRMAPVDIDLDITDVRRIRIVVGYGADADVADHLDLAEARVTK